MSGKGDGEGGICEAERKQRLHGTLEAVWVGVVRICSFLITVSVFSVRRKPGLLLGEDVGGGMGRGMRTEERPGEGAEEGDKG